MNRSPRIAIVILNWNGLDDTVECLDSIRRATYDNYKVVLVDNGSVKDEGKRLKEMFPEVHFIQNKENRGFAGGNNDGIRWAFENGFEYVVNLNNDCIVERDWLSKLIEGILSRGADFGVSRIMFYPDTDIICSYGEAMLFDGSAFSVNQNVRFSGREDGSIAFANGAASIYSRRCLEDVKLKDDHFFDELFFAYCEDVDLGIRLNARGYKGVSVPGAVVYHKLGRTAGQFSVFNRYCMEKNRMLIELLNYPFYLILPAELFSLCKTLLRSLLQGVFYRKGKKFRYMEQVGIKAVLAAAFRAKVWILSNMGEIIRDRLGRRNKGMVNTRIARIFYWDMERIFKS